MRTVKVFARIFRGYAGIAVSPWQHVHVQMWDRLAGYEVFVPSIVKALGFEAVSQNLLEAKSQFKDRQKLLDRLNHQSLEHTG